MQICNNANFLLFEKTLLDAFVAFFVVHLTCKKSQFGSNYTNNFYTGFPGVDTDKNTSVRLNALVAQDSVIGSTLDPFYFYNTKLSRSQCVLPNCCLFTTQEDRLSHFQQDYQVSAETNFNSLP